MEDHLSGIQKHRVDATLEIVNPKYNNLDIVGIQIHANGPSTKWKWPSSGATFYNMPSALFDVKLCYLQVKGSLERCGVLPT